MSAICVHNEIKPLKKVLVHRPGKELLNLTPNTLERLLFDDIPYLKVAQEEHDRFTYLLKQHDVEVVYLEDLMTDVLNLNTQLKEQFLRQFILEAGIKTTKYQTILFDYLMQIHDSKELVLKTMEGININELDRDIKNSLVDLVSDESKMVIDPMPNLYFTRDSFSSIGNGVSINKMLSVTRSRETIYGEYIFTYHPEFAEKVEKYYDRYDSFHIEGGDILNLSKEVLAIGISQRTSADAIDQLANNIFNNPNTFIRKILAFKIPNKRAFMHLDTVFTQIDVDKFTIHPGIMGPLEVYEITPGNKQEPVFVRPIQDKLECILESALGLEQVTLIKCGGDDQIAAEREQWNDGSNTLCIAPGVIIVYERNEVTNAILKQHGLTVIEMPSSELSRGRGGPRCMSMPLIREE